MGFSASSLTILHSFYSFYLCIISVFYSHIGTQKTRTSVSKSAIVVLRKPCHRKYMQKPTRVYRTYAYLISTRKCGYTHEHLPMSCYRIKLMKFLRFQEVDLQALVNAVASATRSQKADTAPLNQQATCASAPPTD